MPQSDVDIPGVELDARYLQLSDNEEGSDDENDNDVEEIVGTANAQVSSITCASFEDCASIFSCPWESLVVSSPSLS